MKTIQKTVGIALMVASFSIVGVSLKPIFADLNHETNTEKIQVSSFGDQQKVTSEEEKKIHDSVDAIYNKYGEFRRSTSTLNLKPDSELSPDEIVYTENDINSKTKELVTDYGVFIKQ